MKKPLIIIIIFLIAVAGGYVVYDQFIADDTKMTADDELGKFITECEARVAGTDWDKPYYCYMKAAVFEYKDMDICSKIPDSPEEALTQKHNCYTQFAAMASLENDLSYCEELPDTTQELERIVIYCYGASAYSKKASGLEICNNLYEERKFSDLTYQESCFNYIAGQCTQYWIFAFGNPEKPAICEALMEQFGWSKDELVERNDQW